MHDLTQASFWWPAYIIVFQSISSSAMVPEQWHTALLMPIYKGKGQLADPSNYRPLSIPDVAFRLWGSILNQPRISCLTPCLVSDLAAALLTPCWCYGI
jgi:hypothetical protein